MIQGVKQIFSRYGRLHWPEYGAELLGTAFNLFVGLNAVVFNFGKGLPMEALIPDKGTRLLITGLLFAGSGSLFAISPLGKLSGSHLNPSVSLAFWAQGKMHQHDVIGYIIAQFFGAITAAVLVVFIWGNYAASVSNGMTVPGQSYALWYVFLAEVTITFLLVLSIFIFLSSHRLMRWTPLMTWLLVATIVWLEAPISGTSLSPARSIGPALVTWYWKDQWLYCIAPPIGAIAAVVVFRLLAMGKGEILTGKLFHVPNYRCIFKNVKVPHRTE
ncbi:MIP/aquaporin family protein [Scytonema sp. PCC 10023]|uniref:MIP/aquaporin family protein n=1 Tax=Scytonema sp. PCC 10023 TaxID=1680591 RepID=UPI0039C70F4A